jgi:hypothetical protein
MTIPFTLSLQRNAMQLTRVKVRIAAIAAASTLVLCPLTCIAQKAFPSAEAAADAFVDAVARSDSDAMRSILGKDYRRFIPLEGVDEEDIYRFLIAWSKTHQVVAEADGKAVLQVGERGWQLPIPIAKSAQGWRFDVRAGADEMRTRRIGRNELSAMQAALAYYDAQKEYADKDRNADAIPEYAQRIMSTPGKHDGLYWPSTDGEDESPLGPAFYPNRPGQGYHGYHYKILTRQGSHAPGGAYNYVIGGRMRGGFALVAWPVKYGDTGVMTFIVSHDGVVYQKDLGPGTDAAARRMASFDPDSSWAKVDVPAPPTETGAREHGDAQRAASWK